MHKIIKKATEPFDRAEQDPSQEDFERTKKMSEQYGNNPKSNPNLAETVRKIDEATRRRYEFED